MISNLNNVENNIKNIPMIDLEENEKKRKGVEEILSLEFEENRKKPKLK